MLSPLRKLLLMVVAISAMVLLAPLAASAHEGHAGSQGHGHMAANYQPAIGRVHAAEPGKTGPQTGNRHFASDFSDQDGACTSGCCFGMGCCAGAIVSVAPILDPPAGPLPPSSHAPRPLSSAGQVALIEPPETLA